MIRLTIRRQNHDLINNQLPSIVYHHLNQFVFYCLLFLSLTFTIQSESNLTTTPINLIDSDDLTTSYTFLNPVSLGNDSEPTLTVDLSTKPIAYLNNSSTNHDVDYNETTPATFTTINPIHVTVFLNDDDEVNTLPSATTINFDGLNNLTESDSIYSNEIVNSSSLPTINPNFIFKSSTLPNDDEKTPTINLNNQSAKLTDSETTTIVTIDLSNNDTINSSVINPSNNETTLSSTNLLIDSSNQTICESTRNQIADQTNQRLKTIDHYEAKKFFLFTMILLGLCCLLILIVLILVVYIFRKLTRERTIKIPQINNNNHMTTGGGGGSIEFDTIKDGRFYQWQGNVNSGFESSDLNESTTQSTGYRFLEGSVVPFTDRYHNDLKASSTETFGHHQPNHHHHHLNQSSLSSINSLPKSATITTVDTRL